MIVKKQLNVTLDEFYEFIQEMILQDIKEATGKTVEIHDIHQGYKYKKQLTGRTGQVGHVKTEIKDFTRNSYSAIFRSAQGFNTISYTYQPTSDSAIELTYEEEFLSDSTLMNLNFKLMSFFFNRSNKKRIDMMLNQIEGIITEKRKSA